MSVWGDLRKRSSGEVTRKEDRIIEEQNKEKFKKIIITDSLQDKYDVDSIIIKINKEDFNDEMESFRWDGSRHSRLGDYYIIDHFSEI